MAVSQKTAHAAVPASSVTQGSYIKGESFPDVYFVDRDDDGNLVRRAFFNEQIYFTWREDFNNIVTVTDQSLSTLPLGALMLPKPGVVLVKIQSANEVYAFDDGALHWITSENVATSLYGSRWADYVIDLPPTLYTKFTHGIPYETTDQSPDLSIMKTRLQLVAKSTPAPTAGNNPFAGARFYVDPDSPARKQVTAWSSSRPADATALERIASQPVARWFGGWYSDVESAADSYVTHVTASGALPVLVAYNIPNRDCGSFSAGGAASDSAYRTWISDLANGIGNRKAVVILEPDAVPDSCTNDARLALIADAVKTLEAQPNVAVYIDAGNARWLDAATMATRLQKAGISDAQGFALNVSNFFTNEENVAYGTAISQKLGGKHFVVDTSRNGNGFNGDWCNPTGRSIGTNPTTSTGNALVDAYLWIKYPGESDGTCNGGPTSGEWWPEYALDLVR